MSELSTRATWNGLKFTAQQANSTIVMLVGSNAPEITLEISRDNGTTWLAWDLTTELTMPSVGSTICLRAGAGGNEFFSKNQLAGNINSTNTFGMTGKISASGDIMSLLDGQNFSTMRSLEGRSSVFAQLFQDCVSLTTAPILPATTLGTACYHRMFQGCTSLTTPPALPATTLASRCYYLMFQGCTSLNTYPQLPATNLTGCTYCYGSMFSGCTSLTSAPTLPATSLANYCYQYMFKGCTSLTTVPRLPATNLAKKCYASMFEGCSKLSSITISYTGYFEYEYFQGWLKDVSPTGTLNYTGNDGTRGTSAIPIGWTCNITPVVKPLLEIKSDYQNTWSNPKTDGAIEFDMVSTPSTTYCFAFCYDSSNPDNAPNEYYHPNTDDDYRGDVDGFCDHFALVSDNIDYVENRAATKERILEALHKGKKYRFFYYAGFAHGGYSNPAGVPPPSDGGKWSYHSTASKYMYAYEIWEAIEDAKNVIVMSFDHCYAGGFDNGLVESESVPIGYQTRSIQEEEHNQTMAQQLLDLFKNRPQARFSGFQNHPSIQLWMSTSSQTLSAWYYKGLASIFSGAMVGTMPDGLFAQKGSSPYNYMQKFDYYVDSNTGSTTSVRVPEYKTDARNKEYLKYAYEKQLSWLKSYQARLELSDQGILDAAPSFAYIGYDFSNKMMWAN